LNITFKRTRNDVDLATNFVDQFNEESRGFEMCPRQLSFFRSAAKHMNKRWQYDHEYFQRMIKPDERMNPEVIVERVVPEVASLAED